MAPIMIVNNLNKVQIIMGAKQFGGGALNRRKTSRGAVRTAQTEDLPSLEKTAQSLELQNVQSLANGLA
jgi:hypothetical protein